MTQELDDVLRRLAAIEDSLRADRRTLAAMSDALLTPTPAEDALEELKARGFVETVPQYTVDDVSPYYGTERTPKGHEWTWRWDYVRVMVDNPDDEPDDKRPIRLDTDAFQWMSVGEAEVIAAQLLSAAARARAGGGS